MNDGHFVYFGLKRILNMLNGSIVDLSLSVNVDGLPLFKSNSKEFWPILGCFPETNPFVIGIYYGSGKPNIQSFLDDLIVELAELESDVALKNIICDSPARAYVKCIKGHSGYSSCDKCTVHGIYEQCVVYDEFNSPLRSDASFRAKVDSDHHTGTSPFCKLNINMISSFPYDYMHMVCLGVVRRILLYWVKGPLITRFNGRKIAELSDNLIVLSSFFPSDFSRKPRGLNVLKFWKATEYCAFLLYSSIVTLPQVASNAVYKNFLLLHTAVFILCDPLLCNDDLIDYANALLCKFVKSCVKVYGIRMLVYNVHGLLHIANDCRVFGSLDNFSAFKFENYFRTIKKSIRTNTLPLQQYSNRLFERQSLDELLPHKSQTIFRIPIDNGPIVECSSDCSQFKVCYISGIRFSTSKNDCHIFDHAYNCYKIFNIVKYLGVGLDTNLCVFICRQYKMYESKFMYPCDSKKLNIHVVSDLSDEYVAIPFSKLFRKCCALPFDGKTVVIPMFASLKP